MGLQRARGRRGLLHPRRAAPGHRQGHCGVQAPPQRAPELRRRPPHRGRGRAGHHAYGGPGDGVVHFRSFWRAYHRRVPQERADPVQRVERPRLGREPHRRRGGPTRRRGRLQETRDVAGPRRDARPRRRHEYAAGRPDGWDHGRGARGDERDRNAEEDSRPRVSAGPRTYG